MITDFILIVYAFIFTTSVLLKLHNFISYSFKMILGISINVYMGRLNVIFHSGDIQLTNTFRFKNIYKDLIGSELILHDFYHQY